MSVVLYDSPNNRRCMYVIGLKEPQRARTTRSLAIFSELRSEEPLFLVTWECDSAE